MKSASTLSLVLTAVLLTAGLSVAEEKVPKEVKIEFQKKIEPLLQDYCFDCHGDGSMKGDFVLDEYESTEAMLED